MQPTTMLILAYANFFKEVNDKVPKQIPAIGYWTHKMLHKVEKFLIDNDNYFKAGNEYVMNEDRKKSFEEKVSSVHNTLSNINQSKKDIYKTLLSFRENMEIRNLIL